MLRVLAGAGVGFIGGYCMPKISALSPIADPIEDALRQLPFPTPTIKLTYFDLGGVAEKIRLTCAVGHLPFSDVRIPFSSWPELKPKAKFGQLPLMEVDGKTFAQSSAMLLYVGKLTGLYPSDPLTAMRCDEVIGVMEDLQGAIRPSILIMRDNTISKKEAQRKQMEMRKELADTKIPETFGYYESLLAENKSGGFFVGSKPSIADMAVFQQLKWLKSGTLDGVPKTCADKFPQLTTWYVKVSSLPEVEAWYESQSKAQAK